MKKLLVLIASFALLMCALSISAFANEVPEVTNEYYLVQALDSEAALALNAEGKTNVVAYSEMVGSTKTGATSPFFSQFADGAHIKLTLAEDILSKTDGEIGVLINTPITVTIVYNGFTHVMLGQTANSCFVLKHSGSTIRLIGNNGLNEDDLQAIAKGESPTVVRPAVSNGSVTNWDELNVDVSAPDKVYVWVHDGDAYLENIRGYAREEIIYSQNDNSGAEPSKNNTYVIKNCVLDSDSAAVGLQGEGSAAKIVKILGGWYNKVNAYTVLTGSIMEDAIIKGDVYMDCWNISGQVWVLRNSKIGGKISSATGRTHFELWDCEVDISKIAPGSDGGGKGKATIYTSATCTEAGTKTVKQNGGSTEVDTAYSASNPAKGHVIDKSVAYGVSWENYFQNGTLNGTCVYCGEIHNESVPSASPLVENKGYSYSETDGAIAQCFKINRELVSYLGEDFDYGVMAKINLSGEEITPKVGESGVVSASFKDADYSIFNVKVTSIPEEYKDTSIVICAYLTVGEKTYYLDSGKTSTTIVGTKYFDLTK